MTISRYAIRQSLLESGKRPGFVISVIVTMGLTMGALIAVLTLGYLVLFKPLPYPEQEKLVALDYDIYNSEGNLLSSSFIYPAAESLYTDHCDIAFSQCTLLFYDREVLASDASQRTAATAYVTPEWFNLLASKMALGRALSPEEGFADDRPVAVVSYRAWQDLFDGRDDILQQSVRIAGTNFQIVGVVSPDSIEPTLNGNNALTDIWMPWFFNGSPFRDDWSNNDFRIRFLGKLKPGVNATQAASLLSNFSEQDFFANVNSLPRFADWSMKITVKSLKDVISSDTNKTIYLLVAGVAGLLIIAVANITNFFMARTAEKYRQLAIKAALGARKSHLRSEIFLETFLLLLVAALFALGIAHSGFIVMQVYFAELLPRLNELGLNYISVSAALVLIGVLTVIFVYVCSSLIDYKNLNNALQTSGKGTGATVSKRARNWLIASQVAVAAVLTFSNLVLFGNAIERIDRPMGFSTERMVNLQLDLIDELADPAPVLLEFERKLLQLPEIEAITFGSSPLISDFSWNIVDSQSNQQFSPMGMRIDHRYFDLLDIPLIAGDAFSREQLVPDSDVVIVNKTFARMLSPDLDVTGRTLNAMDRTFVIIGIVDDIYKPGSDSAVGRIYAPADRARFWMLLQLKANQKITHQQLVDVLREVDGRMVVSTLDILSETKARLLFAHYATAVTTAVLAVLTILLAGVGLYGVLSYSTQMRAAEIAVRRAIGARHSALVLDIFKDYSGAFLTGATAGIIFLVVLIFLLGSVLSEFMNWQLLWGAIATVVLVGSTAALATYLPLRPMLLRPVSYGLRGKD